MANIAMESMRALGTVPRAIGPTIPRSLSLPSAAARRRGAVRIKGGRYLPSSELIAMYEAAEAEALAGSSGLSHLSQTGLLTEGTDMAEALAVIEGVEGLTDSGLTALDYLEVSQRRKASKSTSPGKGAVQSTP